MLNKHCLHIVLVWLLYCNPLTLAIGAFEIEDDSYAIIKMEISAQRVISLAPNVTELIYAAGGGKKLVGVVEGSDYPSEAKDIPTIGTYEKINTEKILKLKPDVVIGWYRGNSPTIINHLKKLKLKVFLLNPIEINDITTALQKLGLLMGTTGEARLAIEQFEQQLKEIKITNFGKIPRVFIQIWDQPLITLNQNNIYSKIITFCGGVNIFSRADYVAPTINIEEVIKINPDVILLSRKPKKGLTWQKSWQKWTDMKAVQNKNIFYIDPDFTERATPRIIEGIKSVCKALGNE